MDTQSILDSEAQVSDCATLYYEGMFWKAYERSAYLIFSQIRAFKPTRKFIKKIGGQQIISIGFPDSSLESLMKGYTKLSETHISRTYGGFIPLNEQDFLLWKSGSGPVLEPTEQEENRIPNVIKRLKEFDLLNHSPYECMMLVEELKRMLA